MPRATSAVGGGAVQAHGDAQRRGRVESLREQRAEHAGENVARARARERGVAAGVHVVACRPVREHAAGALQHDVRAELLARAPSRRATRSRSTSAVALPSRRAASAGCGVASVGAVRAAHRSAQRCGRGQQVEGVGVEHERHVRLDRAAQRVGGRVAGAHARAGDDRRRRRRARARRCRASAPARASRPAGTTWRRSPAGPCPRRRAGGAAGEDRRAGHAGSAPPTIASVPNVPLCTLRRVRARPIAQERGDRRPVEAAAARAREVRIEAQRVHGHDAGASGPIAGEQARLQRDERRGRGRPDGRLARERTGVRVEAGRHVQREDRRAAAFAHATSSASAPPTGARRPMP